MSWECPFRLKPWHAVMLVATALCLVILSASVVALLIISSIIEDGVRQSSVLAEDGPLLTKWTHPQYSIQSNMWVFSVRNPDSILHNNSVPLVKKEGPYVFDQRLHRKIHSITNGTVKYESFRTYFFNEEESCQGCFLHNRLWIPNLIYQKFVDAASKPELRAATAALVVQTPFLEVEVSEMLFDGYADPFLDQVCQIPFVNFVCESILDLPDKIGIYYGKNGSSSGVFEVMDGHTEEGNTLGQIIAWNGKNMTPAGWWSTDQSRMINGTDGTLFKPFISKEDRLPVFVPEICRTIHLVYQKEIDYHGVRGYRFMVPKSDFDFALPENRGFCNERTGNRYFGDKQERQDCLPNGLLDVSRCQKGEPSIVISMPNFLFAPDYVRKSIEGLREPDDDLDHIEVDMEPRVGAILAARRRFQVNIAMWRGINLSMPGLNLNKFRSSIVPVALIEEHSEIDADSLRTIKEKLLDLERNVHYASVSGIFLAVLAVVFILGFIFLRRRRKFGSVISSRGFISPKPQLQSPVSAVSNGVSIRAREAGP